MSKDNIQPQENLDSSENPAERELRRKKRKLKDRLTRRPAAFLTSLGLNLAGSAGAGGVILGNGETLVQKAGNAVIHRRYLI